MNKLIVGQAQSHADQSTTSTHKGMIHNFRGAALLHYGDCLIAEENIQPFTMPNLTLCWTPEPESK